MYFRPGGALHSQTGDATYVDHLLDSGGPQPLDSEPDQEIEIEDGTPPEYGDGTQPENGGNSETQDDALDTNETQTQYDTEHELSVQNQQLRNCASGRKPQLPPLH
ncbi:hypothetical protein K438DRAFT_1774797 [Mycena galopus ATCC 62051]|nr:hypothetical protein K438DRAFT_1774797 [Mycena galopus ATCC 62051]